MKKIASLWKIIKYYNIIPLVFLGEVLYFIKDYCIRVLENVLNDSKTIAITEAVPKIVYIMFAALWLSVSIRVICNKRYYFLTGRKYSYDSANYRPMTYSQLVEYFKDADPHKLDTAAFPQIKWLDAKGLIFGRLDKQLICIPSNSEINIAVFGPPGQGKTSGIGIINAMRFEGSVLAIDVKGDIYNFCKKERDIVRFCPDSPDAIAESYHFDPLSGINDMNTTDKKLYIESISLVLIPDQANTRDNYFEATARIYFQGITHLLLHRNPNTSFPDIIHAILTGNCFDCVKEARNSECQEAREILSSLYGNNEKNISGAYNTLCTAIKIFANPVLDELLTNNGKCISIDTLEQGKDIYLQITQEHLQTYAPLFTIIIQSFSTAFTRRPDSSTGVKNRPILMLLDEFPALTYSYNMISSNLSTLRSKSIICMIIQQNLAQLKKRYGSDGTEAIIGNCHCMIILGSNDIHSSRMFSDTIGTHKVLIVNNSESLSDQNSKTRNIQQSREPVFLPEDFGDLGKDMIIYFKGKYCRCQKLNCYTDK
ncbi:MAG: type IV secretory system conjugative DNA transfer family protein [Ruminococcus sp.]|nr:type IV secretory system conjugative DNA transfer family protein [Ruminococcus sp.]